MAHNIQLTGKIVSPMTLLTDEDGKTVFSGLLEETVEIDGETYQQPWGIIIPSELALAGGLLLTVGTELDITKSTVVAVLESFDVVCISVEVHAMTHRFSAQ